MKFHRAVSPRLDLRWLKIAWNTTKVGVHGFLLNGHPNQRSHFNSKKLLKSETSSCGFPSVGFKVLKVAQNACLSHLKVGMYACLSHVHPNL